jgi:hypothetical protein
MTCVTASGVRMSGALMSGARQRGSHAWTEREPYARST